MSRPKFPDVIVRLTGTDGNAFSVLGRCQRAAEDADVPKPEIDAFLSEAMSGDYQHLLRTCGRYFTVK